MVRTIIFTAIAIVVIAGGVYYSRGLDKQDDGQAASENQNNNAMNTNNNANELKIEDVLVGSGASAKAGDTVTVHYTGTFADGRKFDSSLDRGEPFSFTIGEGRVIQGWEQGVVGMQAGGTRKLVIPPDLGYGPRDHGPIPGGSTLYFTIDLLNISSPAV